MRIDITITDATPEMLAAVQSAAQGMVPVTPPGAVRVERVSLTPEPPPVDRLTGAAAEPERMKPDPAEPEKRAPDPAAPKPAEAEKPKRVPRGAKPDKAERDALLGRIKDAIQRDYDACEKWLSDRNYETFLTLDVETLQVAVKDLAA